MTKRQTTIIALLLILSLLIAGPALAQNAVQVILHQVTAAPAEDGPGYQVLVLFSALDSLGRPLKNLTVDNFTLSDNGTPVELSALHPAGAEPIGVVLAIDTSQSMAPNIEAAKEAAIQFTQNLKAGDQIAIFLFDSQVRRLTEFTDDLGTAVTLIEGISYTPNGGTCLYDALYESVELATTFSSHRRAVVLLTDGRDEISAGVPCSSATPDDVVALAGDPTSQVPIYPVGLGNAVDARVLQRFADQTGGRYESANRVDLLTDLFSDIASRLNSQLVLEFQALALSGEHTLTLQLTHQESSAEDSIRALFPALPPLITLNEPAANAEVNNPVVIDVSVSDRGLPFQSIVFKINGTVIDSLTQPPFRVETSLEESGPQQLEIYAIDRNGNALGQGINTSFMLLGAEGEELQTDEPSSTNNTATDDDVDLVTRIQETLASINPMYLGIGGGLVVILVIVLVLLNRRKKGEPSRKSNAAMLDDMTIDGVAFYDNPEGKIIVEKSDDDSMVGQEIMLVKFPTALGRSADNDLVFPKDSPVSREHATIEKTGTGFRLKEVMNIKGGVAKGPTYGTFVNDEQVSGSMSLADGDLIQLGPRLKMRFKSFGTSSASSGNMDQTIDDFDGLPFDRNDDTLDDTGEE